MKYLQVSKGNKGIWFLVLLSSLFLLGLLCSKFLISNAFLGFAVTTLIIVIALIVARSDKQKLNKSVAIGFIVFFSANLLAYGFGKHPYPLFIYLIYIADILFIVSLLLAARSSEQPNLHLFLNICFAFALVVMIGASILNASTIKLFSSGVAILLLLPITLNNRQGANFLILCQLVMVFIDGLARNPTP